MLSAIGRLILTKEIANMPDIPRLNGVIKALEEGKTAFAAFTPAAIPRRCALPSAPTKPTASIATARRIAPGACCAASGWGRSAVHLTQGGARARATGATRRHDVAAEGAPPTRTALRAERGSWRALTTLPTPAPPAGECTRPPVVPQTRRASRQAFPLAVSFRTDSLLRSASLFFSSALCCARH